MTNHKISDLKKSFLIFNTDGAFISLVVFVFFCFGLVNILNHEMWRDEWESWLVAKDSNSIGNLFYVLQYTGHPRLWYLCLYLFSRFTDQPIVMQLFHLLLALGSIYIFIRFSPFTKAQKILFTFGYFPLFEYATIARNYALGILCIFAFCALYQNRFLHLIALSFILFLLTQTNVYGLILAVSFASVLMLEYLTNKQLRQALSAKKKEITICILIFLIGILSSVYQIKPPPDSGYATDWFFFIDRHRIAHVVSAIWQSYMPIPQFSIHFWNTNILSSYRTQFILSIILMCFFLFCFSSRIIVLFLYIFGTLGILTFSYIKFMGDLHHYGHLFILLLACLWIAQYLPYDKIMLRHFPSSPIFFEKSKTVLLTAILSVHLIIGIAVSIVDWLYPFSASKDVATYIEKRGMNNMLMLGYWDFAAQPVSGYLNRKMYYPNINRFGSFVTWNKERDIVLDNNSILQKAEELKTQKKQDVLIILNFPIDISSYPITKLSEFVQSIVPDEVYYVYYMKQSDKNKKALK